MRKLEQLITGPSTTAEALEFFDSLESVEVGFMIGSWKGEGFDTNHPLDGLLEAYHWHGKRFENSEDVQPLVFSTLSGRTVCVDPKFMGPFLGMVDRIKFPKSAPIGRFFQLLLPLFSTSHSRARLRMTTYRDQSSATMIYDHLPINDVFKKVDENTVLGVMDFKGMKLPFFFLLRREGHES
jgi:hypothetical protein